MGPCEKSLPFSTVVDAFARLQDIVATAAALMVDAEIVAAVVAIITPASRTVNTSAAGTLATVMIGTMLVLPVSSKTENRLLSGASFSASADTAESRSCGENATWTLDTEGKLTAIGDTAFASCESFTEIAIPEGVTTIGSKAFGYCTALTSVTIPSTVTQINDNAFVCCKNCKDVHMHVTDPSKLTWEDTMHNDFMPAKMTFCHVPSAALSDYQARFATSVNVTFVADK